MIFFWTWQEVIMNKTFLIFRHEFLGAIKRVSWIVMTLIVPVLVLLGIGLFALVSSKTKPSAEMVHTIGYVDEMQIFDDPSAQGHSALIAFGSKEEAYQALMRNEVKEYIIIPSDYFSSQTIYRYTLEKELVTPPATIAAIKSFLTINLLKERVPADIVSLIVSPLDLDVTRITERGVETTEHSSIGNLVIPGIFSLLLGLALMFGATSLVSGLGEEKESRLIEILFSSVSVRQLLFGKVLALGTAGLLQVLIWLVSAPLLLFLISFTFGGPIGHIQIPVNFLVLGILYFILGYLLFAVLSISVGAISSNAREGGQLSMFYTMASFIPLWFSSLYIAFPNSPIWIVFTLFPVTAPVQTMLRLGGTEVPLWQIITSLGLLGLSVIGGLYLSIKIFRMNMLMHGKRPSLREVFQGLKKT
jgi:ABC-2 type transport system permease protein